MPLDDLPRWLPAWCVDHLGAAPVRVLLDELRRMSAVFGLRLADGRDVVVKAREDGDGRVASCLAAQARLAERGFPCAGRLPARSASVRWPCTLRSSGPAARCCTATRPTSPRATPRCSPS